MFETFRSAFYLKRAFLSYFVCPPFFSATALRRLGMLFLQSCIVLLVDFFHPNFHCSYKLFSTGWLLFCHLILHVASLVFHLLHAWAVSRPVRNLHLVFPKTFRKHFLFVTSRCSSMHKYRGGVHDHVYIQTFLKQLTYFRPFMLVPGRKYNPAVPCLLI